MNELGNWLMATFDAGTSCHVNSATVFFVTNVDETDVTNKLWCSVQIALFLLHCWTVQQRKVRKRQYREQYGERSTRGSQEHIHMRRNNCIRHVQMTCQLTAFIANHIDQLVSIYSQLCLMLSLCAQRRPNDNDNKRLRLRLRVYAYDKYHKSPVMPLKWRPAM